MVATYDIATLIGKVRLKIGDIKILSPVFQDDEIQYFLTDTSNNINMAAAQAAEAWAAKYAASVRSETIGGYAYSQTIVQDLLNLAKTLRAKDTEEAAALAATPAADWAEMDLSYDLGEEV